MAVTKINDFNIGSYSADTVFVLDTNVLYYVHSGYYLPNDTKSILYSNVILTILTSGYAVKVSALSVQELLYGVENKEYLLYCQRNGLNSARYTKKQYRSDQTQRACVKHKLTTILSELSPYRLDDGSMQVSVLQQFVNSLSSHKMDPVDYMLTQCYDPAKTVFISDDKDFQTLTSIQVLTA